ncbi:MAG: hypothetical protein AAF437_15995 [Pseudomonadota bacterium]
MKRLAIPLAAVLPACAAAGADDAMTALKQQALDVSPLKREIAASDTFFSCNAHPEPDRYDAICEICNVDLFPDKDLPFNADPETDAPVVGVKGWATHYYHEFKPRDGVPEPRISATGERASEKFETRDLSVAAIQALFDEANAWCKARGDGEFRLLKNDIVSFVDGVAQ